MGRVKCVILYAFMCRYLWFSLENVHFSAKGDTTILKCSWCLRLVSIYRCHFPAIRMPIMIWCEQINGLLSRPQNEWAVKWIDGGEVILFCWGSTF